jgi:hypothetical protein
MTTYVSIRISDEGPVFPNVTVAPVISSSAPLLTQCLLTT